MPSCGCRLMVDLAELSRRIAAHGPVARLVIAAHDGSSPREVGAAMLVWATGQSGTIGGGALEWEATLRARDLLARMPPGHRQLDREALGPKLGQCCGGAVQVMTEIIDAGLLAGWQDQAVIARPAHGATDRPLAVTRILAAARGKGQLPAPQLVQGWMVESVARPMRQIWVWGAGHVGRALVDVLAPLPGLRVTWIDTAPARFPGSIPENVTPVWADRPELLAEHAEIGTEHLIVTYSHALDLELCHRLLLRGFGHLGLIGSQTKWARFRSRLAQLGHGGTSISRITCPIGDPALGKHPQAIAIGVAAALLKQKTKAGTEIADDTRERGTAAAGGIDQGLSGRGRQ